MHCQFKPEKPQKLKVPSNRATRLFDLKGLAQTLYVFSIFIKASRTPDENVKQNKRVIIMNRSFQKHQRASAVQVRVTVTGSCGPSAAVRVWWMAAREEPARRAGEDILRVHLL